MLNEIAQLDADPGKVLSRMLETGEYLYLVQCPGGTWITAEKHRRGLPGLLIITEGLRRAEAARAAQPPPLPTRTEVLEQRNAALAARTPPRGQAQAKQTREAAAAKAAADTKEADRKLQEREDAQPQAVRHRPKRWRWSR